MKKMNIIWIMGLTLMLLGGCGGKSEDTGKIGVAEARDLALADAGIAADQVDALDASLGSGADEGRYKVVFTAAGKAYEYEIDAASGTIVKASSANAADQAIVPETGAQPESMPGGEQEQEDGIAQEGAVGPDKGTLSGSAVPGTDKGIDAAPQGSPAPQSGQNISVEDARAAALAHAGLTGDQAVFVKSELDYEDGVQVYEIGFYSSDHLHEYDYEIDARTGAVLKYDHEVEHNGHNGASHDAASGNSITADRAKEIALAKVPGAAAGDIREFESDYDDGRLEYEGKIVYGGMEYEFEIDAADGTVLKWEAESSGH